VIVQYTRLKERKLQRELDIEKLLADSGKAFINSTRLNIPNVIGLRALKDFLTFVHLIRVRLGYGFEHPYLDP